MELLLLKFRKAPNKALVVGYYFRKVLVLHFLIPHFIKLVPQQQGFPENVPKFSEELFLQNISGQLFLNLQASS